MCNSIFIQIYGEVVSSFFFFFLNEFSPEKKHHLMFTANIPWLVLFTKITDFNWFLLEREFNIKPLKIVTINITLLFCILAAIKSLNSKNIKE